MPTPRRVFTRGFVMLVGAFVLIGATVIGAGALMMGGDTRTLTGTFELFDASGVSGSATSCYGNGGYDDIGPATQVTLKNDKGNILAVTHLGAGTGLNLAESFGLKSNASGLGLLSTCRFTWEAKVPGGEKFYVVSVGRRGEVTYPKADLDKNDWHVGSNLG